MRWSWSAPPAGRSLRSPRSLELRLELGHLGPPDRIDRGAAEADQQRADPAAAGRDRHDPRHSSQPYGSPRVHAELRLAAGSPPPAGGTLLPATGASATVPGRRRRLTRLTRPRRPRRSCWAAVGPDRPDVAWCGEVTTSHRRGLAGAGSVLDLDGTIFHTDHSAASTPAACIHPAPGWGCGAPWPHRIVPGYAVTESWSASLKVELVDRQHYRTRAEARASIFAWIHRYNRVRLHSTIGYLPPVEWERQHVLDHPLPSPVAA